MGGVSVIFTTRLHKFQYSFAQPFFISDRKSVGI